MPAAFSERTGRSLEGGRPLDPLKKRDVAFASALLQSNFFSPVTLAQHVPSILGLSLETQGDPFKSLSSKTPKAQGIDHFAFDVLQGNVRFARGPG